MQWTVENYLALASIIIVALGAVFGIYQWFISNKVKRAEFINEIISKLRFDDEMANTMYMFDYGGNWYDGSFHNSDSDIEIVVDKLLSYLSYICYLHETNNITKKEFAFLEYELHRACVSPSTQRYLWNLYHFSNKFNQKCSFDYIINYGIKNKIFHKSFTDKKSAHYINYKKLNF